MITAKEFLTPWIKLQGKWLLGNRLLPLEHQRKKDNSALIETVGRISISGSAADDRKQSEVIRTVMIFDDLILSLRSEGFELGRFLVYLRYVKVQISWRWKTRSNCTIKTMKPWKLTAQKSCWRKICACFNSIFRRNGWIFRSILIYLLFPWISTIKYWLEYLWHTKMCCFYNASRSRLYCWFSKLLILSVIIDMQIIPKNFSREAASYSDATYVAIRSAKHTQKQSPEAFY